MPMNRFVLDTSIFTNPDVFRTFGPDAQEAIRTFSRLARATRAEFFMPGSVYEELGKIKDLTEDIKRPDTTQIWKSISFRVPPSTGVGLKQPSNALMFRSKSRPSTTRATCRPR